MSGGQINIPVVFRGPANGGVGVGSTHSHTPHNLYSTVPGLKIVSPSNAYDAKGLLKSSVRDLDPVCFLEHTVTYNRLGLVSSASYFIPLGKANIKLVGKDITLISYSNTLNLCLEASLFVKKVYGVSVEVIDLRTIRPLDELTILKSIVKTNKVILVEECKPFCSVSSFIGYLIQSKLFYYLDRPIKTVVSVDSPNIYSTPLEKKQIPNIKHLVSSILKTIY
jgi:pyruvate dehydrogenase E1 component beta subunit